jgi:hypothetical protein
MNILFGIRGICENEIVLLPRAAFDGGECHFLQTSMALEGA